MNMKIHHRPTRSSLNSPRRVKSKSMRIAPPTGSRTALKFRSVTQSVDEAVVISDAQGTIIFWNKGAETIFGYAEKEIIGKPLALLVPVQSSAFRGGKLEQVLFNKASPVDGKTHELRGIHASGRRFPVELSLLTWTLGAKVFFTTIIRDITERKRLQKEILEISGREQQRIGQDLHDDLCQQLTAISLLSEVLEKKLSDKSVSEATDVSEIHRLIVHAIVQTRLLAKGLLPVDLEAQGLMAALEDMAATTEKLTHIPCHTEGKKPVLIRDRTVAVHLYRIAQEAVTNAVKHARAQHIAIKLIEKNKQVVLSITDDGSGIPPSAVSSGGMGLSIMNSRAETIGAALHIQQGSRCGTVVTCSLLSPHSPKKERYANASVA
jgi:two-component system, LuxR family, sensor kinase FixL